MRRLSKDSDYSRAASVVTQRSSRDDTKNGCVAD